MICITCQKDGFSEEELKEHMKECKGPNFIKHTPVDAENKPKTRRTRKTKTKTDKDLKLED